MRKLADLFIASMGLIAIAISGCNTPQPLPGHQLRLTDTGEGRKPFLSRGHYPDRVGLAIDSSLRKRQFIIPWIAVSGPDGSTWFVTERFLSEHRFDRVYVRVTPDEKVTVSITAYQLQGSDWASLGRVQNS